LKSDGETQNYYYLHRDYLGSIVAISDQEGKIIEKRLFDAWGQIANYKDNLGNTMPIDGRMFIDRGYTGHEMILPNTGQLGFGLVNMNGRLYDPKLHRFLMPDQHIQNPYNTQNYNRYTYVLNNPLRYIDPSGEEGVDGNGGWCDGCSGNNGNNGLSNNQQTAIGSAIATIANNWDNWKIKDWSNRNFNIKNIGNSVGNGLNSINNFFIRNILSIAEDIGGWFGIPKHHNSPPPVQNFQLNGPLPSGLGMDSGNYMGGAVGFINSSNNHGMVNMTDTFTKQLNQTKSFFEHRNTELNTMVLFPGADYFTRMLYFTKLVKTNAPFDLKNKGYGIKNIKKYSIFNNRILRFDDYGNINYGVAARAYGISLEDALMGAGLNQIYNGRSALNPIGWFDDQRDTQMIINGYYFFGK